MHTSEKPLAPACERNREPILNILRQVLPDQGLVLEIGSGTGQHAAYFAPEFPALVWQTSDLADNHPGIEAWRVHSGADNIRSPIELDVSRDNWPIASADAVFSANTAHIMPWEVTRLMIAGVGRILTRAGVFALYGPFNYGGEFTSQSNAGFDVWLKDREPAMGIRDFEAVVADAQKVGMVLQEDFEMPANNRMLVFEKC